MQKRRLGHGVKFILLAVVVFGCSTSTVFATTSNSNHYQVSETQFGSGSTVQSCSGQYCAKASIGDPMSGKSTGVTSTASFGPEMGGGDPLLEVIVDQGESNLGVLSAEKTATKTMTVRIRNYLSDGYTLQIVGDPPKFGGHTLKTPTTPTASKSGTEQFAINAVENTSPKVGSGLVQVPSDAFSFGSVTDNYGLSNLFMYKSGDVVARSKSESGRTDYTISMIVNVSNATPAGHYTGDFSAIVIPVY